MGLELLGAAEQFGTTGPALVDAGGLGVGVLTGERTLGAGATQDVEFLRVELLAPLVIAELDARLLGLRSHASTLARSRSGVSHAGSILSSILFSALASSKRKYSTLNPPISNSDQPYVIFKYSSGRQMDIQLNSSQ